MGVLGVTFAFSSGGNNIISPDMINKLKEMNGMGGGLPMPVPNKDSNQTMQEQDKSSYGFDREDTPAKIQQAESLSPIASKKPIKHEQKIPNGARVFDLEPVIKVPIVAGSYTTIDFPFEVNIHKVGEFKAKAGEDFEISQDKKPFSVSQYENRIIVKGEILGSTELYVTNEQYPVIVKIYINKNKGNAYNVIKDNSRSLEQVEMAKEFEGGTHEEVISSLVYMMKKGRPANGYTTKRFNKIFDMKEEKIRMIYREVMVGNAYLVEKWSITNKSNTSIQLYEEMFYDNNPSSQIYAISLDNDVLDRGKSTNLYIVRGVRGR